MPEHDVENRAAVFGWPSCSKPLESITFVILDQPHPTSSRSVRRAYNMGSTVRSKKMAVSEPSSRLPAAMSRPCERRDPSVSAIALIAAPRTLVSVTYMKIPYAIALPQGGREQTEYVARLWIQFSNSDRRSQTRVRDPATRS